MPQLSLTAALRCRATTGKGPPVLTQAVLSHYQVGIWYQGRWIMVFKRPGNVRRFDFRLPTDDFRLIHRIVAVSWPSCRSTSMVESGSGSEAMMSFATAFSTADCRKRFRGLVSKPGNAPLPFIHLSLLIAHIKTPEQYQYRHSIQPFRKMLWPA